MIDKVVVTSGASLRTKYGAAGMSAIDAAIRRMLAADAARGLAARIVDISVSGAVPGGPPPTGPAVSPAEVKAAIDALCKPEAPDYVLLLGGPDVLPYVPLKNPVVSPADPDRIVPSDLPYACDAAYAEDAARFLSPSRVVARLPDLVAATEPSEFVSRIDSASGWAPRAAARYAAHLGISARVWSNSTTLSLRRTFGGRARPRLSPKEGPAWSAARMRTPSHFVNCHGAPADPRFYGQEGASYPVAHEAKRVHAGAAKGCVVSAECCYGADLYDPALAVAAGHPMGIADAYLHRGAWAYLGSTTVAYGPADGNAAADLLCQFFLQNVLAGASVGRAALDARLAFVRSANVTDPIDLKTLAQFVLLADPSVQPVESAPDSAATAKAFGESVVHAAFARRGRRLEAHARADEIASTQAVACVPRIAGSSQAVMERVRILAEELGMRGARHDRYEVAVPAARAPHLVAEGMKGGPGSGGALGLRPPAAVHVLSVREPGVSERAPRIRLAVIHEQDGTIMSVRQLESR